MERLNVICAHGATDKLLVAIRQGSPEKTHLPTEMCIKWGLDIAKLLSWETSIVFSGWPTLCEFPGKLPDEKGFED